MYEQAAGRIGNGVRISDRTAAVKLSVHSQTIGREAEKVNGDDEAKSEDLPVKTSIGFFGQRNFREIIAYVAR